MANYFDKTAKISELAIIDISTRGIHIHIGEDSEIDAFVRIKHVGGNKDIKIGKRYYINSGTTIYSGNGVTTGDDALMGPNSTIAPVNHEFKDRNRTIHEQGFMPSKGGIIIKDDVWIRAVVKKGAAIGANSLVKDVVEPYSIQVGIPCKKIGERH